MKKLVLVFAAFAAISFASCGNKAANNTTESTTVEAVEEVAKETADSTACCDHNHAACDSTKVAE